MGVQMKVYTPLRKRDYKGTLAAIKEVAASDPDLTDEFDMVKFSCLGMLGEIDAALAVGTKLVERYKEDSANLNAFAWGVVNPDTKPEPDTRLAQARPRRRPPRRRADEGRGHGRPGHARLRPLPDR